jgi:hypothetical protein
MFPLTKFFSVKISRNNGILCVTPEMGHKLCNKNQVCVLCDEVSHITCKSRKYKISSFCLLSFHYVIRNNLLGKLNRHQEGTAQPDKNY